MSINERVWTDLAKNLANEFDNYVFKQFERHGYSKLEVMVAGVEGRLTAIGDNKCKSYGIINDEYPYDPKYLFNIKEDIRMVTSDNNVFSMKIEVRCEDIVEPKGE